MIELREIEAAVRGHSLVRSLDVLPSGPVRLETAFLYPDGGSIDLFVVEDGGLFPATRLTDLAQTMAWLMDVQVKPWLSNNPPYRDRDAEVHVRHALKRQGFLEDAIRLYGVQQRGGELFRPIENAEEIVPSVVALGQACVRASDLMFTKRSVMVTSFSELP